MQVGVKERISVLAVDLAGWVVSGNSGPEQVNIVKRINNLLSLHYLSVLDEASPDIKRGKMQYWRATIRSFISCSSNTLI